MNKIYPNSGVELTPFIARYYDSVMNLGSMGLYRSFIKRAIKDMQIKTTDTILDLGCGTGRNARLMAEYLNNEGKVIGVDLSSIMKKQFENKSKNQTNINFQLQRIDIPFDLEQKFDKIFISFVIHGFPHKIRQTVIQNAYNHLKPGGSFYVLDFAEFNMNEMPPFHRYVFEKIECQYAFDYIKKDWKSILKDNNFGNFTEHFYLKKYIRLLKAVKLD